MSRLRFVLVTDGSSDAALKYPPHWLLAENGVNRSIEGDWFNPRELPNRPESLAEKIRAAVELNDPCDLLFVHRDAENDPRPLKKRSEEIRNHINNLGPDWPSPPHVCVIPVRMTEAWFLLDEAAIRMAVDNPHGRVELKLPAPSQIEALPSPKDLLHELMRTATEKNARRLRGFSESAAFHRLAGLVQDFSPLRNLSAFAALEQDIQTLIQQHGWNE